MTLSTLRGGGGGTVNIRRITPPEGRDRAQARLFPWVFWSDHSWIQLEFRIIRRFDALLWNECHFDIPQRSAYQRIEEFIAGLAVLAG